MDNDGTNSGKPFSGELDPEIANLMGLTETKPEPAVSEERPPDFTSLFEEEKPKGTVEQVDFTKKKFEIITKTYEEPKPYFGDRDYYKKVLSGEGEEAKRLHSLFTKFLQAKDPQDKSLYRGKLISAYWDLASRIAARITSELPLPKILLLRFGVLAPNLITREQQNVLASLIFENNTGEPVHYMDEWLKKVAMGVVHPSATDEVKKKKLDSNQKLIENIEKKNGQRQTEMGLVAAKIATLEDLENQLSEQIKILTTHDRREEYGGMKDSFNPMQKSALSAISDIIHSMSRINREIEEGYRKLDSITEDINILQRKAEGVEGEVAVDSQTIIQEFNSVRQMAKLCVGKQGNHFPILMKQYARLSLRDIGSRENVINEMAYVEKLDPGIFLRTFKGQTNRIVPHVILLPNYGDSGICWEPFERFNRATSRGRIAIPMYSKNLRTAVISALADLRWQIAKEKAQHYWMEEGITGKYYQWFESKKMKGDVKDAFIRDYILWITKESEGTQKLDREVRGIFWRNIPFPQEVKDLLKNRGFVYNELYKKDVNIARSDGY